MRSGSRGSRKFLLVRLFDFTVIALIWWAGMQEISPSHPNRRLTPHVFYRERATFYSKSLRFATSAASASKNKDDETGDIFSRDRKRSLLVREETNTKPFSSIFTAGGLLASASADWRIFDTETRSDVRGARALGPFRDNDPSGWAAWLHMRKRLFPAGSSFISTCILRGLKRRLGRRGAASLKQGRRFSQGPPERAEGGATRGGGWAGTGDQGGKPAGYTRVDSMSLMLVMDGPTGAPADWRWSRRSSTGGAAVSLGWLLRNTQGESE